MGRSGKGILLFTALALAAARVCWAAPGDLDPSYGTGGWTTGAGGRGTAAVMQADGKLLVASSPAHQETYLGMPIWVSELAVTRLTDDGAFDTDFDGDGTAITAFFSGGPIPFDAQAAAVAVQADGKIVVAGRGGVATPSGFESHIVLARYETDGSLDTGFGSGGKVVLASASPEWASAVAIQSDDRIVVAGSSSDGSNSGVIARLEASGALDTSFGSGGKTTIPWSDFRALLIRAGGEIVAAGTRHHFSTGALDSLVVQLDGAGALDGAFGSGGEAVLDLAVPALASDRMSALTALADGRVLTGGYAYGRGFTIARLATDGSLDASFGTGGIASTLGAVGIAALAQTDDGSIIAAGSDYDGLDYNTALARFSSDGVLDPAFGSGGVAIEEFVGNADDYALGVFVRPDRKVVIGGIAGSILAARFELGGPHRPIAGRRLLIRNPPAGPAANKLVYTANDAAAAAPATLFESPLCAPDGSGAGGGIEVAGLGGDFTIALPCAGWTRNPSGTRFKYRDTSGATCRSVRIHQGRLEKAVCIGSQVTYALGAAQGEVAVTLRTGVASAERVSCARFAPATAQVVRDGSDAKTYLALRAIAPASCP